MRNIFPPCQTKHRRQTAPYHRPSRQRGRTAIFARLAVWTLLAGTAASAAASVTVEWLDVDGDGMPEIVLANKHLRVVVDQGTPPVTNADGIYDDRFVRGGWIRSLQRLPTGEEFILQSHGLDDAPPPFSGLREEFETPIPLFDGVPDNGASIRFVKIGVGVFRATADGDGGWRDAELEDAPAWRTTIEDAGEAGMMVTCGQTLELSQGVAYSYEIRFLLAPDARQLVVAHALTNVGLRRLSTLWHLHPFFAPEGGRGYGRDTRLLLPVKTGDHRVDLSPVRPLSPDPLIVRGTINQAIVAAPWMAVGTSQTGPWLSLHWHRDADWLQVWTVKDWFAVEPFFAIELETNQTWRLPIRYEVSDATPGFPEAISPPAMPDDNANVLVLTSTMDEAGKMRNDLNYMVALLREFGGEPTIVDWATRTPSAEQWQAAAVVVVVGDVLPPAAVSQRLRAFVAAGGGLLTNSPALLAANDWLPATATEKTFRTALNLRDDSRHRAIVSEYSLHLTPAAGQPSHPILQGLPLWPFVAQDIARAVELEPADSAIVVAEFAHGGQVADIQGWPAVIADRYGEGRIVVVACPVAWGNPPVWVNWTRLGEHHRQFWRQCLAWAADKNNPIPNQNPK